MFMHFKGDYLRTKSISVETIFFKHCSPTKGCARDWLFVMIAHDM